MPMHHSSFDYLSPTKSEIETMTYTRAAFSTLAATLQSSLPDGPDKTHVLRLLRTAAMWANVAITRHPDGSPRRAIDDVTDYPADHPVQGDLGSNPL